MSVGTSGCSDHCAVGCCSPNCCSLSFLLHTGLPRSSTAFKSFCLSPFMTSSKALGCCALGAAFQAVDCYGRIHTQSRTSGCIHHLHRIVHCCGSLDLAGLHRLLLPLKTQIGLGCHGSCTYDRLSTSGTYWLPESRIRFECFRQLRCFDAFCGSERTPIRLRRQPACHQSCPVVRSRPHRR